MLAARILLLALSLALHVPSAFSFASWTGVLKPRDILWCEKYRRNSITGLYTRPRPPPPPVQDCFYAIDRIPQGPFFDPHLFQQIGRDATGRIPYVYDKHKCALPAVFRSGRCLVRVFTVRGLTPAEPNGGWPLPYSAAKLMYGAMWPLASDAADEVVKRCLRCRRAEGSWMYDMHTAAGDWIWQVQVEFATEDTQIGKNGGRDFNVYNSTPENRICHPGAINFG